MKYLQLGIWHAKGFQHKKHLLTATTTDLGIWLNGKMVLYLEYLTENKKFRTSQLTRSRDTMCGNLCQSYTFCKWFIQV